MTDELSLIEKLHGETARICWLELQRFFAQGAVMQVADTLDLVKVAAWFAEDNHQELEIHFKSGAIAAPSDAQARTWYTQKAELWGVVVAPFVLVQERIKSIGYS